MPNLPRSEAAGQGAPVGHGGRVFVEVGGCDYCQEFAGEAVVGEDPLPPFHPNCTCYAYA